MSAPALRDIHTLFIAAILNRVIIIAAIARSINTPATIKNATKPRYGAWLTICLF